MDSNNAYNAYRIQLDELPDKISEDEIKKIIETSDNFVIDDINESNIENALILFKNKVNKNYEDRIKYPNDPEKFLKSEVDLDETLCKLKELTTSPTLLSYFIQSNYLGILVPLLNHDNIDITATVVSFLLEITDLENLTSVDQNDNYLKILENSGLHSYITELLFRIQEEENQENYDIVTNCLQIIDHLIEIDPVLTSNTLLSTPKFLTWLLKRIKPSKNNIYDVCYNRLFAAEILSILLQNSEKTRDYFREQSSLNGMDRLLRCLAVYRKQDPMSSQEFEFVANIGNSVVTLFLDSDNKVIFKTLDGIPLMVSFLHERKKIYNIALKILMYALENSQSNCNTFIEEFGLKSLFGLFMKQGVKYKAGSTSDLEEDELCTTIILHLFKNSSGVYNQRLLSKFIEKKYEKIERLLELHQIYIKKIRNKSLDHLKMERNLMEINEELQLNEADILYLKRCEMGLFTLQNVANIIVRLLNLDDNLLIQNMKTLINVKGINPNDIFSIIEEYTHSIEEQSEEKTILQAILDHSKRVCSE